MRFLSALKEPIDRVIICRDIDKNKMINKKYWSKKASMSYAQILILIISSFAFCYLIYSATEGISAQESGNYVCCEKTLGGNICQFIPSDECNPDFNSAPTKCDKTSFCKIGCCISSDGFCSEKSAQKDCDGGKWFEDEFCNIPECKRGCCVLGNNALWATEKNCEIEAGFLGLESDFKPEINSELECIFLTEREDEGACVFEKEFETSCVFTTKGECKSKGGDFYKNIFCSDASLGTNCASQDHKGCADNKNGDGQSVYWFDSCGNKEDSAEECSIFAGTICGLGTGSSYSCKSVNCEVDGKTRKNGESWCEYDGTIGDGKDVVGSRHVRHICFMGKERIEPCSDYRNQICVGTETDLGNGETFSEAACRINNWRSCMDYNMKEGQENIAEKCNENPDCKIQHVEIDDFKFDMCAPEYPPGFDLTNEASGRNAEMVCGMGSQKCTVIYVKKLSGWKCKVNCDCEKAVFTQQMNDLCISLGDCGGYVNIAGDVSDDGYTSGAGKINLNQYKKYADDKPGQEPAEPGDLSFLGEFAPEEVSEEEDEESFIPMKGLGVYGVGFALQVYSYIEINAISYATEGISGAISSAWSQGPALGAQQTPSLIGAFGNALAAAGAAMVAASIMSMAFDLDYLTALAIIGGGIVAVVTFTSVTWTQVINFAKDPITLIVLLIIIAALKILGIGKAKKKVINFQCLPWQPPTGGKNCDKCNAKGALDVPCSDYRCKSLGQTCELINKGTKQELCIDNSPIDISSPRISPLYGEITEGYEYYNIQNNGFELIESGGNCIPEFTPVTFGIETDKPSQCKIATSAMQGYDEIEDYFGGSNLYLTEHTVILNIPSPSAFKNQYNLTDAQIAVLGEIDFYVKCKSVNGIINGASYTIRTCIKPGPDLTAPYIARTKPENKAYIKYGATEQDLQIYVNEPADCKYSKKDKNYEDMENSMSCQTDLEDYGLYGWACNATLSLNGDNKFYIKCRDKSENQNTMRQSYVYELSKSASELIIEDFRPVDGDEIFSGVEPMTLELQVKTSGGAENGKAICKWEANEYSDQFTETGSNYHSYTWNNAVRGRYNINFLCEDSAGNTADASTSFKIRMDTIGPRIIRMYYDAGLKIITNENAECRYDFKKIFNWENATMMSGLELEHTADWQMKTYYIQCKDDYGNKGGKMAVRAYSLI